MNELRFGQRLTRRQLLRLPHCFRKGQAYVRLCRPGRVPLVYELDRVHSRWRVEAMGRADLADYADIEFAVEESSPL